MVFAFVPSVARDKAIVVDLPEDVSEWTSQAQFPFMQVDVRVRWALALKEIRVDALTEDGKKLRRVDGESSLPLAEKKVRSKGLKWKSTFSLLYPWKGHMAFTSLDVVMREATDKSTTVPTVRALVEQAKKAAPKRAAQLIETPGQPVARPTKQQRVIGHSSLLRKLITSGSIRTIVIARFGQPPLM
jgi:hypothetical protein